MHEHTPGSRAETDQQGSSIDYNQLLAAGQNERESARPPYNARELSRLFMESFRFSQGTPDMQYDALSYVAATQHDRIDPAVFEEMRTLTEPMLRKFVDRPSTHTQESRDRPISDGFISQDTVLGIEKWEDSLRNPPPDPEALCAKLALGFLAKDTEYLTSDGRPRSYQDKDGQTLPDPDEGKSSRPSSRYLSHVVYYGLLGRSTGNAEYDQMYRSASDSLLSHWDDPADNPYLAENPYKGFPLPPLLGEVVPPEPPTPSIGSALKEVARIHFEHYPADRDQLPDVWSQRLEQ